MGKMGGIEVEEDHDINNLGLNDQSTINKESDNGIKLGIKDIDVFLKSKKIDKDKFLIKTKNNHFIEGEYEDIEDNDDRKI